LNGEVASGLFTQLELRKIETDWFPNKADVIVQTSDQPNEKFISTLYFKGYELDLPLYELDNPAAEDSVARTNPSLE
jgi:hypothetical protein